MRLLRNTYKVFLDLSVIFIEVQQASCFDRSCLSLGVIKLYTPRFVCYFHRENGEPFLTNMCNWAETTRHGAWLTCYLISGHLCCCTTFDMLPFIAAFMNASLGHVTKDGSDVTVFGGWDFGTGKASHSGLPQTLGSDATDCHFAQGHALVKFLHWKVSF